MAGITSVVILFTLAACSTSSGETKNINYGGSRAPLRQNAFLELPLGSITPQGWLLEMLNTQKEGATGHLDEIYPAVMGPRNGWLGGDGDQWERGPYWIDGLLPLAYILKDPVLIEKTRPWIEWALASQQPDGYFGPATDYGHEPGLQRNNCRDWWPKMVMLKVMMQYHSATGDERVIGFMTRYFHYQLANLDRWPLDNWSFWSRFRGGDNMMAVYWLYNITGDGKLLELGKKLYEQTEPFTEIFLAGEKLSRVGSFHSVNLAQGLKTPIVYWQADPQDKYIDALDRAIGDLELFHGLPTGMFTGDEAIHGTDPTQGVELCTIVEYMFSLETMYKITGNPRFAEILERVAYNALPTQVSDDFMTRQYFQQTNQIEISRHTRNFDVNHDGLDNCFGLLTGYPCCTSNMHQGWPKFTQNLWYATSGNGVAATQYAPSEVNMLVADGVDVRISEKTVYPFGEAVTFRIEEITRPASFPFSVRIPSWSEATEIFINGKSVPFEADTDKIVCFEREWSAGDELRLEFTPRVKLSVWHENARTVERGPLVYAMNIEATSREVENFYERVYQGDRYHTYTSVAPWNYALIQCPDERMEEGYKVVADPQKAAGAYPWNKDNAPITIKTRGVQVTSWREYNGSAGPLPYSIALALDMGKEADIELIPYGCTTLRIAEFPMKGRHSAE